MNVKLHTKVKQINGQYQKVFRRQGNYTACILMDGNFVKSIGIAKRNPNCDEDNADRGREIALARAVKNL